MAATYPHGMPKPAPCPIVVTYERGGVSVMMDGTACYEPEKNGIYCLWDARPWNHIVEGMHEVGITLGCSEGPGFELAQDLFLKAAAAASLPRAPPEFRRNGMVYCCASSVTVTMITRQ